MAERTRPARIPLSPGAGQKRKPIETPGKRFWKMWGPLLIKWGIGIGVGMVVMAAMMVAYMKTHYQTQAALEALMSDQNKLMGFYEKMLNKYIDYTTWVEGLSALVTIPVMAILYHGDRKKEKKQVSYRIKSTFVEISGGAYYGTCHEPGTE